MEVDRRDDRIILAPGRVWNRLGIGGRREAARIVSYDVANHIENPIQLPASLALEGESPAGRIDTLTEVELFPGYPISNLSENP